jgi:glycosyltransferase involved in cell wall biosynthesis
LLVTPGGGQGLAGPSWPELAACADVFIVPALGEVCTEPIATAMAAGLPVVGFAVRSVAELIGSGHNGLLAKPGDGPALAQQVLRVIEDDGLRRRLVETARAQAYEIAGVRDCVDSYARLYDNVASGRVAGDGVRDTATALVA